MIDMSISIKPTFCTSRDISFNEGGDNGSLAALMPRLQSMPLEAGDIDFGPASGPSQGISKGAKQCGSQHGAEFNFTEMGEIDFQPRSGSGFKSFAHPWGQGKPTEKPDDNENDFMKAIADFMQQLMSFFSRFFENQKQDDGNPVEKPDSISTTKRLSVSNDHAPNMTGPSKPVSKPDPGGVKNNPDTGNSPVTAVTPTKMPDPTGTVIVDKPIVVKAGETFDGGGKHYKAGPSLGDGGRSEGQKPVFILENGAKLKNLQISGADGVHVNGDATVQNVWWRDVGEDALTKKKEGNVRIIGGGALDAHDKVFIVHGGGSLSIEGFTAKNFGRLVATDHRFIPPRNDGTFPLEVSIKNSNLTNGDEVFRTDAANARITFANVDLNNVHYDARGPQGMDVIGGKKVGRVEGWVI